MDRGGDGMTRLWRRLGSPGTGTSLLLLTALWLAAGSATMRLLPEAFRPLMRLALADWLATVIGRPWLWWWMVPLVVTAALLGASTARCVVAEVPLSGRVLGIACFHLCVLCFLMGHLLMEFGGVHLVVPLRRGEAVPVAGTGLSLTLSAVDEIPVAELPEAPTRRRLSLEVTREAVTVWRSPAVLSPARAHGFHLHVPMYGGPPPGFDAVVELRRNPGLSWFAAGVAVLVLGCLLVGPSMASRLHGEVAPRGRPV